VQVIRVLLEYGDAGHVLSNDSGVLTERDPDTLRGAEVAYYSYQKVPKGPLAKGLLPVPPDLVFEVLSPTDRWSDVHEKVAEYLHVGVGTVCVLDPDKAIVHVYHAERGPQSLSAEEELTLPDALPDFRVAVRRFFG
jgi:Uma2 family endonuclease